MIIRVNGKEMTLDAEDTLSAVMIALNVNSASAVCILNDEPVAVADYASTRLKDGDRLELLAFVGGG